MTVEKFFAKSENRGWGWGQSHRTPSKSTGTLIIQKHQDGYYGQENMRRLMFSCTEKNVDTILELLARVFVRLPLVMLFASSCKKALLGSLCCLGLWLATWVIFCVDFLHVIVNHSNTCRLLWISYSLGCVNITEAGKEKVSISTIC